MKMPATAKLPCLVLSASILFACAAQQQQAAEPTVPAATEPAPLPNSPPVAAASSTSDEDKPEAEPKPAPTGTEAPQEPAQEPEPVARPEPTFDPIEVLTGGGTAFVVDYANSGAKEVAEKLCKPVAAAHPEEDEEDADAAREKQRTCLAKERTKFTADVIRFRRDPKGQGTVAFYRRTGSSLPEVYVAKVTYQETDKHTVKVIVKGSMTGMRPLCRERPDFTVKVPNGYSIELEDSQYGKIPYDAKVGLVGG
jgi:hypothetical protein